MSRKKQLHSWLVFWPDCGAPSTDTYLAMCRWMGLVDKPKSGAGVIISHRDPYSAPVLQNEALLFISIPQVL
jgi:hypothetical protein